MRARAVCARCKRERYLDHLRPLTYVKGAPVVCASTTTCKAVARTAA